MEPKRIQRRSALKLEPIKNQLLNQDLLQEWAMYSLKERVELIRKKFDIKASSFCLRDFYIRHKVGHRRIITVKNRAMQNKSTLDKQRFEFAIKLQEILKSGRPTLYVDETTYSCWSVSDKAWSFADNPVYQTLCDQRYSTSVIGAIGTCLDKPVTMLTNN